MKRYLTASLLLATACAHAGPADPPTSLHAAIQEADRIVIRDGGFNCCGPVDNNPVIFVVTNLTEIAVAYSNLQFSATGSVFSCMCCGYPGIDWYIGTNLVALTGVQHGKAIRWSGFSGDAPLTQDAQNWLKAWLVPKGVNDEFMPSRLYKNKIAREQWEKKLADQDIPYKWFTPWPDGRLAFQPLDGITDLEAIAHLPIGALHLNSCTNEVDISAITNLPVEHLYLDGVRVRNLSPIRGLKLTFLRATGHAISDLSILHGMPLESVDLSSTAVSNLSPLVGMPLKDIDLDHTSIRDLEPLRGMRLQALSLWETPVSDISALAGMPLERLDLNDTAVSDIMPLSRCPLQELQMNGARVTDISILKNKDLHFLWFNPDQVTNGVDILRGMTNLQQIGANEEIIDSKDFWKKWDAGELRRKPEPPARPYGSPATGSPSGQP